MTTTREISWTTGAGQKAEVTIQIIRDILADDLTADGVGISTTRKAMTRNTITATLDGKYVHSQTGIGKTTDKKVLALGAVAQIGRLCLKQDIYDMICAALADAIAEAEAGAGNEYHQLAAEQAAAEKAQVAAIGKSTTKISGRCPKCGTWCDGDCEAN